MPFSGVTPHCVTSRCATLGMHSQCLMCAVTGGPAASDSLLFFAPLLPSCACVRIHGDPPSSAELPLQPSGTLLQRTQCRSSSSPAPVAQSQAVTSVVMAGQDKLQPVSKEPPTLILPVSGLLGIPGALVLRIRLGKYVGRTQLCQSRAQPSPMGWAEVRRGNLQEVHSWAVSFPRMLQVQPCLYVVQVPWASFQGLLHVAAPSKEACAV